MNNNLDIREIEGSLVFRVTRSHRKLEAAFGAIVAVAATYVALRHFVSIPVILVVASIVAAISFVEIIKATKAELRITHDLIESLGSFGERLGRKKTLRFADVKWFEYQEDTSGPETSHHPGGLYAVLKHGSVCTLPYIDETQTASVIDQIFRKFPELRRQAEQHTAFGKKLTSLDIGNR